MPGFSSYDDLINEITINDKIAGFTFFKATGTMGTSATWFSLARLAGIPAAISDGAAGSGTPGAGGTALTDANGTYNLAAQTPDIKSLLYFGAAISTTQVQMILYDRLVHVSGIAVNSTGSKNVGSAALPRYTTGVGVQAWLEFTTGGQTTANTVHLLTYTDTDGNTGQIGGNISSPQAAMIANTMLGPLPLAAGDTGIKSVETLNVDTACTSGVVQLVLMKPLAYIGMPNASHWYDRDLVLQFDALPRIYDGASLCLMVLPVATTLADLWANIQIGWG